MALRRDRVRAPDGRVGGGFRYTLRATQPPPPYRDHTRLTIPALAGGVRDDGVDAWLDKEKLLSVQD
ncbi:MAG: hypothetical protein ACOYZ8_07275 [Chloroflexota bacterium]